MSAVSPPAPPDLGHGPVPDPLVLPELTFAVAGASSAGAVGASLVSESREPCLAGWMAERSTPHFLRPA